MGKENSTQGRLPGKGKTEANRSISGLKSLTGMNTAQGDPKSTNGTKTELQTGQNFMSQPQAVGQNGKKEQGIWSPRPIPTSIYGLYDFGWDLTTVSLSFLL